MIRTILANDNNVLAVVGHKMFLLLLHIFLYEIRS